MTTNDGKRDDLKYRLIKSNAELGIKMAEALVLLRRWLAWQSTVQELAPDGLVEESLEICGMTAPKEGGNQ